MAAENNPAQKKKKPTVIIIFVISCVIGFILLITLLVDLILVSSSVSPVFSRIVSKSLDGTKHDEVIESHGILYSTIEVRDWFGNGYYSGYKFYLGYKKWSEDLDITVNYDKFNYTEDEDEIIFPEKSTGDDFIDEDEVLNLDAVRKLALGNMSPFVFMEKFPMFDSEDSGFYYVHLPNDYAVRIEYSGDTVEMYLDDNLLGNSLDLQINSLDLEQFLSERD